MGNISDCAETGRHSSRNVAQQSVTYARKFDSWHQQVSSDCTVECSSIGHISDTHECLKVSRSMSCKTLYVNTADCSVL